jgi:error-prone DNA polymerase
MRGVNGLREILERARKQQCSHLALTEVNGLWGFIHFVQTARDYGIEPICGANLISENADVVLLVESQTGYENLCRLISAQHENKHEPVDLILRYHKGLFILSHQEYVIQKLYQTVPDSHLFVEMRIGQEEGKLLSLAEDYRLEPVVTGDVYFLNPEEQRIHKLLRAIDNNTTLSELGAEEYKSERHFFQTEKQLLKYFPNSAEAINNAYYLGARCKTDWSFVNTIFPGLSLKKNHQAKNRLRRLVYRGAKARYGELTKVVRERIEYELSIIIPRGFAPYFLVVHDIVKNADSATIGRGSGAASIISYCLFITQVDPIKYNLVFERFIHPERVDMPDIDIDFPWDERDDVLEYVFAKYGQERSAMVANQVFMKPRSAVRETGKVYGLSNEEIKAITKRLGYRRKAVELLEMIKKDKRFRNVELDETLEEVVRQSEKIVGAFRHPSVHPGGVILVPEEIRKHVPVLTAPKGVQIVEWEKDQVEDSGLLKIDILGNRSLAVVRDTLQQLRKYRNLDLNYHRLNSIDDRKTRSLMEAGQTMGVFYIESPATRQLLAKSGRADFEHVVLYSSIIRPAANKYTNIMLERIHGKPWKLLHPDLEWLKESYGIMVYEEQVSMTARKIAGFTYSESDYIRKVISRPKLAHLVPAWKKKFIKGTINNGYSRKLATTLWDMIKSFSGYSFCKPHSASFARLSFTCAYLKAHYPAEFLAAVVTNQGGYYSTYAYLSEARRMGIEILLPDINLSNYQYKGRQGKIRMGLMTISNLKLSTVKAIVKARKNGFFESLEDFFRRMDIDFSDAMALTNAGCFAALEPDMSHKEIAFQVAGYYLQDKSDEREVNFASKAQNDALSDRERMKLEIESFGFPVSQHPLEPYLDIFKNKVKKARDIEKYGGQTINLLGVFITRKVTSTRNRKRMAFVTFEDETDIYECVMFPEVFEAYGDLLNWESLFVLKGKVEEAWGCYTITIKKLGSLSKIVEKMTGRKTRSPDIKTKKIAMI